MTPDQAMLVKVGDRLTVKPLWNQSEGNPRNRLPGVLTVVKIEYAISQTGCMLTVETSSGNRNRLDAGWFDRA